jgi:hypothetical protein
VSRNCFIGFIFRNEFYTAWTEFIFFTGVFAAKTAGLLLLHEIPAATRQKTCPDLFPAMS